MRLNFLDIRRNTLIKKVKPTVDGISDGEEQTMREMTEIRNLQEKNPLFREFCGINGLKEGDYYSAVDYIDFCDSLTLEKAIEITRKYAPY